MNLRHAMVVCFLLVGPVAGTSAVAQENTVNRVISTRQSELVALTRDIELTETRRRELRLEIESLETDRATLNSSLIEGSQRVQQLEGVIDQSERRLRALLVDEDRLRQSLSERRRVLSEVLAALQRLGYRTPPVIMVRPEDALASVRSAILLGAVIPQLRDRAASLTLDLQRLVTIRQAQERERDRLREDALALIEGRTRIALLIEQKRLQRTASLDALEIEERRAAALAAQVTTLRELIARLETENATVAAASVAADRAARAARRASGGRPARSLGSVDRLTPAVAFGDAKGLLPLPANGRQITTFGKDDGFGGIAQGTSLETRSGAQISSPTDGWVVYAGEFRSYGRLLIINAGDDYHILLAGMGRIDVQLGQFVLAGEPVGEMATPQLASLPTSGIGAAAPVLYIEFRKDGVSIDPTPWWAASNMEKVGG
ncbi:MAG: murein hydrolase activator EnvC family protein [Alphaproteobacteria bacterium]